MTKYCGVISIGATTGGGYVSSGGHDPLTGQYRGGPAIPVAVELVSFRIGGTFFRKLRLCQAFVSQFIHPGDDACIYVYKQLGLTNVVIGVKSKQYESYAISFRRMLLMMFSQYLFGCLFGIVPAMILLGWLSTKLALFALLVMPSYGAWTLYQAWQEIRADF